MLMMFFSSRRRHTRLQGDWSSDVCSSDLLSLDLAPVHLHFTGERSNDSQAVPHPEISPTRITLHGLDVPVMCLQDLVLTRLNSERTIDRVSIRSMDALGLVTVDLEATLPERLRSRLQNIRDTE